MHGSLSHRWLLLLVFCFFTIGAAQHNVTLEGTAPEIMYSPPACNSTAKTCESAWQVTFSPDAPGDVVTSTSGPTTGSGDVIPQLFLTFIGMALHIRTSTLSNATANVTLSTEDPTIAITTIVNTSAGLITIIGLPDNQATTLSMTFIVADRFTRLDISNLTILAPNNQTSPFSSNVLPTSTPVPTFLPVVSVAPLPREHESKSETASDIIAEVLGAVLCITLGGLGAATVGYYWKRRQPSASITAQND